MSITEWQQRAKRGSGEFREFQRGMSAESGMLTEMQRVLGVAMCLLLLHSPAAGSELSCRTKV